MAKIALIFPYFRTKAPTELLFPPLGVAYLSSQLTQHGIAVKIFDCTFSSIERLENDLISYKPEIVGIYSMIGQSRNVFRIVQIVKEKLPGSLLAAGGPMPTLYPQRYSEHFDVVFRGEADLSFPRFCRDYLDEEITPQDLAKLPLEIYDGLTINKSHLVVNNSTTHYPEDIIQSLPLPERGDFDHAAYQKAWREMDGSKTTSIITTLGCPFDCDFCSKPIFGNRFRRRPLDMILDEIQQVRSLGYDSLWIADDSLTLDFRHLTAFCQSIAPQKMQWSCLSRVTGINQEVARMMKEAGCKRVYLGLETAAQTTLDLMNKKATVEQGIDAVYQFREAEVEVAAFFLVGYPGESIASIEQTFQLALSLPLDYISFNVPYPLPGSKLFKRVSGLDETRDWTEENEVTFLYESEFDEGWLKQRIDKTMQAFGEKQHKL